MNYEDIWNQILDLLAKETPVEELPAKIDAPSRDIEAVLKDVYRSGIKAKYDLTQPYK